MELSGKRTHQPSSNRKKVKSTEDLVFAVGETNPVIFLHEFEKCSDVKEDKDKLFKIRNFVNQEDRREFSKIFLTSDWTTARLAFLKKYSVAFTENKKRELSFGFAEETSLRSFVDRKIKAMSLYTTLPLVNQLEMILADLPNEISNLFIIHDKMNCTKAEILEFCNVIQEFGDDMDIETAGSLTPTAHSISNVQSEVIQDLEIFNFDEDESQSDTSEVQPSGSIRKRNLNKAKGRPQKIAKKLSVDSETSEFDFIDSSQSTISSYSNY